MPARARMTSSITYASRAAGPQGRRGGSPQTCGRQHAEAVRPMRAIGVQVQGEAQRGAAVAVTMQKHGEQQFISENANGEGEEEAGASHAACKNRGCSLLSVSALPSWLRPLWPPPLPALVTTRLRSSAITCMVRGGALAKGGCPLSPFSILLSEVAHRWLRDCCPPPSCPPSPRAPSRLCVCGAARAAPLFPVTRGGPAPAVLLWWSDGLMNPVILPCICGGRASAFHSVPGVSNS